MAPSPYRPPWYVTLFGIVLALIGLALAVGGARLVSLSGSWYYLLAGLGMLAAGILLARRRPLGAWIYALVFVGTVIWAFWEVGSDFWQLVPRLIGPIVLALVTLLVWPALHEGGARSRVRRNAYPLAGVAVLALIGFGVGMFRPQGVIRNEPGATPAAAAAPQTVADWQYYGRTPAGTRYAPLTQIDPKNVDQLQVAWTFRTGDIADKGAENQNTPIQIGDTLYVCTPRNKVFALQADTGKERWRFDPEASSPVWQRCRGVGYYETTAAPASGQPQPAACRKRIILSTIDARLIALDADTGKPCEDFGQHGTVDLKQGMGEVKPGYYFQTSAPTVVRNMIVIGGWVFDNRAVDEPSGAVRAFNADTGELAWAWDMGDPSITGVPPEGKTYTRGTPNVWSTPAFDDKLGLIYLPTGNSPPDFWGAHRSEAAEKHSSAVVALDIATGRERWTFQTAHHDLWDYDVASQPALYDIPDGKGGVQHALIQVTKRGQIFLLDRANGKPLAEVKELPVPQGAQEGDWTSPTQPYSVGMPAIGTEPFTEASMWGATFFDQLWCRIEFKKMRYEGEFTPPTTQRSLQYPGYYGGMNWGGAAVDESRGYLIVNDIRMPQWIQLIPRADADKEGAAGVHDGFAPQTGTPYGVSKNGFMSPLGVPCHAPPYGTLSAIDLKTRQLLWQVPMSTLQDTGPLGMKTGLQIPIGMPTLGGPLATASGLVFYAGTQDYYLRAMDTASGKELWKARLPVGAQATPMSFVSPKSGRQYVVLSVGGSRQSPDRGDYVIAYALPGKP
ncbi:Quinate/shikimate dehydrogenase (quinone) [Bordetella hinzii]|uniref:membrane-bound PQQ-dependent dehydrogenase, glucose/quinate/shikimate family n=1 Tax=Bordetella hinzii TaxID=103855 RepID=UPI000518B7A0|nr:membrane-bound PQQ-dependent dehydrogenase, glucose/quinate/shikimate family [Bordetella hinzii]AKQ54574.1 Quinate/shikimate dehydrogenase (quinone) [Bordetella hinzii]QII84396.1 membrane-bound PQQ-dependent dehydrogenase, glucose/quinate/shikimate family [Bordetella hinzii]SNV95760.1 Quinate/shikimate dehydrogenase (quinone) [Bordetella hinzii]